YAGNLGRSAVELAKDWRTDRMLRHLEALLIVCDTTATFVLSGTGDVIEPDDGIVAIGSGGSFAGECARADGEYRAERAGDCGEELADCGADLHLYQRP